MRFARVIILILFINIWAKEKQKSHCKLPKQKITEVGSLSMVITRLYGYFVDGPEGLEWPTFAV